MANIYRVDYTACVKVGTTGPNQLRTQTEQKSVYVSATTEANAIAAVKTGEPRNSNANLDYCNFVATVAHPNSLVGS